MKKTKLIVLGLALLAYILLRVFVFEKAEDVGSDVLFLTLLAIVWYSWETQQLRIQSERHSRVTEELTELSLKPHLEVIYQRMFYFLYNIGNGPAVRIQIDDVMVNPPGKRPVKLAFRSPAVVRKDEYQELHFDSISGGQKLTGSIPACILPPDATEAVDIVIHFENLIGKRYEQKLQIGKGVNTKTSPIDTFLYFLYRQYPKGANPKKIPPAYLDPKMLPLLINYCMEKGFIEVVASRTDQEGIVDVEMATLKSAGIDYLLNT
jgi:hypothetical protein